MDIEIIHVDDDPVELNRVAIELDSQNQDNCFVVKSFERPVDYLDYIESGAIPCAVILDLYFDHCSLSGFELAEKTRILLPDVAIIVMTNRERSITKAIRHGANEFISKDRFPGELKSRVLMAIKTVQERLGLLEFAWQDSHKSHSKNPPLIGSTMRTIANDVNKIVASAVEAILVSGESGTGKEVVADLFEARVGRPFLRINCGELKPELIESELFGVTKGAFTGAHQSRPGLIEAAHGGWIYLDEIHCLPKAGQTALLRVIENKELRRLGDSEVRTSDVKIIAASNECLDSLSHQGAFRHDLLNRLCEYQIYLPPLRDRPSEIRELILYFCQTAKGGPYTIDDAVLNALTNYSWKKGNVREIRSCIRVMTVNHIGQRLTALSVPDYIWSAIDPNPYGFKPSLNQQKEMRIKCPDILPEYVFFENQLLAQYLHMNYQENGKVSLRSLAPKMGINRQTIRDRLKKLVREGFLQTEDLRTFFGLDLVDGGK
jgi:DNA-binding NtrC family response regulator